MKSHKNPPLMIKSCLLNKLRNKFYGDNYEAIIPRITKKFRKASMINQMPK